MPFLNQPFVTQKEFLKDVQFVLDDEYEKMRNNSGEMFFTDYNLTKIPSNSNDQNRHLYMLLLNLHKRFLLNHIKSHPNDEETLNEMREIFCHYFCDYEDPLFDDNIMFLKTLKLTAKQSLYIKLLLSELWHVLCMDEYIGYFAEPIRPPSDYIAHDSFSLDLLRIIPKNHLANPSIYRAAVENYFIQENISYLQKGKRYDEKKTSGFGQNRNHLMSSPQFRKKTSSEDLGELCTRLSK